MFSERLTVTFPVYERKDFFKDALLSVINQTVKCHIIVVDNCSSHNYFREVCNEYNIRYYRNSENIGLFPNWNKCMSLVETEYGMIFQDDNIMLPNFVEEFEKSLSRYPAVDLYFTDFSGLNLKTKEIKNHRHVFPYGYMENGNKVLEYGIKEKLGFPYAFIIRRKHFSSYYFDCHGSNDWLWVYSNIKNFSVFGNEKKLFLYGAHPNQDSKNIDTHVKCMISISYIYKEVLKKEAKSNYYKDLADLRFKNVFFYFLGIAPIEFLNSLLLENHIYAVFYRKELSKSLFFKIYSYMPFIFRNVFYRSVRKIFNLSI
ncbi:MAG: glycosyltransferase [Flavobacteriales bacterium]|nr:glycosyltransferase [Flavobacteriales bacterium]